MSKGGAYSEIEATNREEMVCPNCRTTGLTKHPLAERQNTKREKLIYGTQCPNQDCELGRLEPDQVKKQLSGGFLWKIQVYTKSQASLLLPLGVIFAVVILFLTGNLPFGFFSTTPVNVTVTVNGPGGTNIDSAKLYFDDEERVLTERKQTIQINSGVYQVYASPKNNSLAATKEATISINEESVSLSGTDATINKSNGTIILNFKKLREVQREGWTQNDSFNISYRNPINANGNTEITLRGNISTQSTSISTTFQEGRTKQIKLPGSPVKQTLTLQIPVIEERTSISIQNIEDSTFTIEGNIKPTDVKVLLKGKNDIRTINRQRTRQVSGTANTTITLEQPSPVTVTLSSSNIKKQISGTVQTTSKSYSINTDNTKVEYRFEPVRNTDNKVIRGTINTDEIQVDYQGNPSNATIKLISGESSKTIAGSATVSASGEGSSTVRKEPVATVEPGEYTIKTSFSTSKNSELVEAGYEYGNNKKTVSNGEQETTISVDSQTTIYAWIIAKNEHDKTTKTKQYDGDNSDIIEAVNYTVSETDIETGDSVTITASFENSGDETDSVDATIYKNAESLLTSRIRVKPGETKTVELGKVTFTENGTQTVSVNDLTKTVIKVGEITESEYGKGEITTKVYTTTADGKLRIDTNHDDKFDCSLQINGDTCSLQTGKTTYSVEQVGLTNSEYKITYQTNTSSTSLSADLDGDGKKEIQQTITKPITRTKTLNTGNYIASIDATSDVKYSITWTDTKPLKNTEVFIGDTKIGEQYVQSDEIEFNTNQLNSGEYTIQTSAEGSYQVAIKWNEQTAETYLPVTINGKTICSKNDFEKEPRGVCTPDSQVINTGQNTLTTQQSEEKQLVIEYTKRSIPTKYTLTANNSEETISINPKRQAIQNKKVTITKPIDILNSGNNKLSLQSNQTTREKTTATITYSGVQVGPKNPSIIIENKTGTIVKNVSEQELSDEGYLITSHTIPLSDKHLSEGNNTITIKTQNNKKIYYRFITSTSK